MDDGTKEFQDDFAAAGISTHRKKLSGKKAVYAMSTTIHSLLEFRHSLAATCVLRNDRENMPRVRVEDRHTASEQ